MAKDSIKKKAPARSKDVIAQEKLDVAQRNVERIVGRIADSEKSLEALKRDLTAAVKVRDYAALNPDLPAEDPTEVAVPVNDA